MDALPPDPTGRLNREVSKNPTGQVFYYVLMKFRLNHCLRLDNDDKINLNNCLYYDRLTNFNRLKSHSNFCYDKHIKIYVIIGLV